jgi:hypothetical protein
MKKQASEELEKIKNLHGFRKIEYIFDYYKWYFVGAIVAVVVIAAFAHMIWDGNRPYRLRVCAVLNTDDSCQDWFDSFEEKLTADGKSGAFKAILGLNFNESDQYSYVEEAEVMAYVDSKRFDVAVCNEDLYRFLLAESACLTLDTALPADMADELMASGKLLYDSANLQEDIEGNVDPDDGVPGYYAIDLSGTAFYESYNTPSSGDPEPLYAVIIANTEHLDDSVTLLRELLK